MEEAHAPVHPADPSFSPSLWRPQEKWSAVYNVRTILLSIQSLLGDPNLDSPLNGHAASIWHNVQEYKKALLKHKSAHGTERSAS